MRRLIYLGAAGALALTLGAAPATAHNAGCVQNGNGDWVFVGSNKNGPYVSEQNPHYHTATAKEYGRLDLVEGSGDQYGVRFVAEDEYHPAVQKPSKCTAPPPRGGP